MINALNDMIFNNRVNNLIVMILNQRKSSDLRSGCL